MPIDFTNPQQVGAAAAEHGDLLNFLQNIGAIPQFNQANRPGGPRGYPGVTAQNLREIGSTLYPDLPALQLTPNRNIGRIDYGNNKVASRTVGQLQGVGRGVQSILPGILNSIYRSQLVQAPAVTEGNLRLLQQLGPQFAAAEGEMQRAGRQGELQTDLDLLSSPQGRGITAETLAQMMATDPEFFALRSGINERGQQLLAGLDPNQLTEAEIANQERIQNRNNIGTGVANSGSNLAAIKGALSFDDRLQRKRNQLSGVLSNLGNILPQTRSGAFNYANSTGQAGRNVGTSQFASAVQGPQALAANIAQNAFGQGGNIAQNVAQIQHSEIPSWQQTLGAVYGGLNAIGSLAGGAAALCWVAEELYGVNDIKTFLARKYAMTHENEFTKAYKKFGKTWAKWLSQNTWAKPLVQPIWDNMVTLQLKEIYANS